MSAYPGPEYLRTGEYGECDHGVPDCHDCTDCMARTIQRLESEIETTYTAEQVAAWLESIDVHEVHGVACRRPALAFAEMVRNGCLAGVVALEDTK